MTTGINKQEIRLLAHNAMAYKAVKKAFETKDRAAVVHATGSGKSFIIARTAQDFYKVLVIAPNDFVLEETRKICPPRCEFKTYAGVMVQKEFETGYNLIVLDEFHRAGAEKWGEAVKRLLELNPRAKVLGTSANDIRYLDGMRNMADELFDGNVVSRITLKDAIDLGILPNPTYVSSLYSLDDFHKMAAKRIENSLGTDEEKKAGLKHLKGVSSSWQKSHGVPVIIKKYFAKDTRRVIVFCPDVAMAKESRSMLSKWFTRAGFNGLQFYDINYTNKNLAKEMEGFQDNAPGLKVAISVNMLNEGVHVPNVDAIIMLRGTMSRIIIEQQIGRCLTAKNSGKTPVVLDLVNNLDGLKVLGGVLYAGEEGEETQGRGTYEKENEKDPFPFRVIDEAFDIRVLMAELNAQYSVNWTLETCKEEALKYAGRADFCRKAPGAYEYARRHGFLDEVCAHMIEQRHRWTKEEVAEVASHYETRNAFRKANSSAYRIALSGGYLDEVCSHMKSLYKTYTKEGVHELALEFKMLKDFRKAYRAEYTYAYRHDWLKDICSHMEDGRVMNCTKEECQAEALKYTSITQFQRSATRIYTCAFRNGWLDEITAHIKRRATYTIEQILETAKKYKTITEFRDEHEGMYKFICRAGSKRQLAECFEFQHWTKERVMEAAAGCKDKKELHMTCGGAYEHARRNRYLNELKFNNK